MAIELERELVEHVADMGQPLGALDDAVELVAVEDPQAFAVGRGVHGLVGDFDASQGDAQETAGELVVVAGDERHAGALADLAQQLLDHVAVGLRPVPAALELPAVDDVAHQVHLLALDVAQEIQQGVGLATRCAQVHIRDPDRTDIHRPARRHVVGGSEGLGRLSLPVRGRGGAMGEGRMSHAAMVARLDDGGVAVVCQSCERMPAASDRGWRDRAPS